MTKQTAQVKRFTYTAEVLAELEESLSAERLGTYLSKVGGDKQKAIQLHIWNTALSAAFYGMLQGLEVSLRNAMHRQLSTCYGDAWYDVSALQLDDAARRRIKTARKFLKYAGHATISPPQIVAALSFGFWVSLLGPGGWIKPSHRKASYEMTLWRPALRGTFPYCRPLTRKQAHVPLERLRILRNRIAHHEPIIARDHNDDYRLILNVSEWISPTTSSWLEHHSRVQGLLKRQFDSDELVF